MIPTFVTLTPNRGSRDDGKRLLSDGRFNFVVLAKQRGEFEGGGLEIGPVPEVAGFGLSVFFGVFF